MYTHYFVFISLDPQRNGGGNKKEEIKNYVKSRKVYSLAHFCIVKLVSNRTNLHYILRTNSQLFGGHDTLECMSTHAGRLTRLSMKCVLRHSQKPTKPVCSRTGFFSLSWFSPVSDQLCLFGFQPTGIKCIRAVFHLSQK